MTLERSLVFRLPLATGADVRAAQLALIRQGALRGEADGVYGPATRDAVLASSAARAFWPMGWSVP
jgi:peptidoglycan hydrolase-like protein with peptidoglycan-binding domain